MPRRVGRYTLHDEIAAGGMATVHLGRLVGEAGFARTVAIKRLHPHFAKDPEFAAMLVDEARLVARIHHPNVVPTLDVVSVDGELWVVMEYVAGESLASIVKALGGTPIPHRIAASIVVGLLHGLHATHEAKSDLGEPLQIVHRDVSPQNVLLAADGIARVVDFGIAKSAQRLQITREGQIKGKLAYMSPEQLNDGIVDRRCDVYAASVVLWELLASRRMFKADNDYALTERVLRGDIKPPSWLAPSVPPAYDAIVMRGLAHRKQERFATARDMALALEQCDRLATVTEVGAWIESVIGEKLAARARLVATMEQDAAKRATLDPDQTDTRIDLGDHPSEPRSVVLSTSPAKRHRDRRRLAWAAAGVALLGSTAAAIVTTHKDHTSTGTVAPQPTRQATSIAPPPVHTEEVPSDSASAVTTAPLAAPSIVHVPPLSNAAVTGAPKPRTPNCAVPYTIDADGIRHIKRECIAATKR